MKINQDFKVYYHSIYHLCLNMIQQPRCKCWDFLCQMRWLHNGPMPMPPMHCQRLEFSLVLLQLGPCFLPHSMGTTQGVPLHIKYFTPHIALNNHSFLAHSTKQSFPPLAHFIKQSYPPLTHSTQQLFSPLAHSTQQSLPLIKVKFYSSTLGTF